MLHGARETRLSGWVTLKKLATTKNSRFYYFFGVASHFLTCIASVAISIFNVPVLYIELNCVVKVAFIYFL
jgi:hypothetical protein